MLKTYKIKCERFKADQFGIDQLKNEFFDEGREFVYFRKGEWRGFEKSLKFAKNWDKTNPMYFSTGLALYPVAKEIIVFIAENIDVISDRINSYFGEPDEGLISRRVIVSEGRLTKEQKSEWEEICGKGGIAEIPKSQVGNFRYIINEKRYAIIIRVGKKDLRGLMGKDKETILLLRKMFDLEFVNAFKEQNKLEEHGKKIYEGYKIRLRRLKSTRHDR